MNGSFWDCLFLGLTLVFLIRWCAIRSLRSASDRLAVYDSLQAAVANEHWESAFLSDPREVASEMIDYCGEPFERMGVEAVADHVIAWRKSRPGSVLHAYLRNQGLLQGSDCEACDHEA